MLRIFAVLVAFIFAPHAADARGLLFSGAPAAASSGCSQATTFVARAIAADATFDSTHQAAITDYICYLVGHNNVITGDLVTGCGTKLDLLYVEATQSAAVAELNICGASHTLDVSNAGLLNANYFFTVNVGFRVNDSSANWIDPAINLSTAGGNYSLNSAHISSWAMSPTTGYTNATMGTREGSSFIALYPRYTDNTVIVDMNDASDLAAANSDGTGFYVGNRTSSTARAVYKNNALLGSDTAVSTIVPNAAFYVASSWNNNVGVGSGRDVGMQSVGKALTTGEIGDLYTAGCAYFLAVTGSAGPGC